MTTICIRRRPQIKPDRQALAISLTFLSLFIFSHSCGAAGRDNPFLPTTTPAEDAQITQRNEIVRAVREMLPDIASLMQKRFDQQKQALLEDIAKKQRAADAARPTPQRPEPVVAKLPSGMHLIGCSGPKAIFRDVSTHQIYVFGADDPGMPQPAPCGN